MRTVVVGAVVRVGIRYFSGCTGRRDDGGKANIERVDSVLDPAYDRESDFEALDEHRLQVEKVRDAACQIGRRR